MPRWRRIPTYWAGVSSGLACATVAGIVVWFLVLPAGFNALIGDLVSAHVHSLLPEHLITVVSTNRHTVKPWFAGRAEVSPAVAYLESQGYSLAGGRADVLWGQRAAVTVYRHGAHTINIFSWAAAGELLNKNVTRNGCHLDFWNVGNVQSIAVSDIGWNEMQGLVNMQRQLAPHEDHPTTE